MFRSLRHPWEALKRKFEALKPLLQLTLRQIMSEPMSILYCISNLVQDDLRWRYPVHCGTEFGRIVTEGWLEVLLMAMIVDIPDALRFIYSY